LDVKNFHYFINPAEKFALSSAVNRSKLGYLDNDARSLLKNVVLHGGHQFSSIHQFRASLATTAVSLSPMVLSASTGMTMV